MQDMKYITFTGSLADEIVVSPSHRNHEQFANLLGVERSALIGAGFVSFKSEELTCYGESTSLGIKSHARDSSLLRAHMRMD